MNTDISGQLQEQVKAAIAQNTELRIEGGNSKAFYGRQVAGETISTSGHSGIINYIPTELIITARSGTPLIDIEQALAEHGQMLAFEPPHFGPKATLGGTIACGFSGPRRPYAGAARDHVLGVKCLTGHGKILKFGGEVMKNVAGFDASRLMVGAMGTLGILLDISIKVLPRPEHNKTLMFECQLQEAIALMNKWAGLPLPISATAYDNQQLAVRLSGTHVGVEAAQHNLGGDSIDNDDAYWQSIREHTHKYFNAEDSLWRLSLPQTTSSLSLDGQWFIEWGGAQRWLKTELTSEKIRSVVTKAGGYATLFRSRCRDGEIFHPLSSAILNITKRLKTAFDPQGIMNPRQLIAGS